MTGAFSCVSAMVGIAVSRLMPVDYLDHKFLHLKSDVPCAMRNRPVSIICFSRDWLSSTAS